MTVRDAIGMGLGALRQHRLRTLLSMLGVIIGVAALVAVLSLGDGMETFARAQIAETTSLQGVSVSPVVTRLQDGIALPVSNVIHLTVDHLDALSTSPHVSRGMIEVSAAALARHPDRTDSTRAVMVTGRAESGDSSSLSAPDQGRGMTPDEARGSTPVIVVSTAFAEWITGDGAEGAVGRRVTVGTRDWEIIGVRSGGLGRFFTAEVPVGLAPEAFAPSPLPRIPTIALAARSIESVDSVRAYAQTWLRAQGPEWPDLVTVNTSQGRLRQALTAIRVFKIFMGSMISIALLVGGIGIMNILLASVAERTREIGIRRAVGARQRDIRRQFLVEALTITGLGSAIGTGFGLAMSYLATAIMRMQTEAQVQSGFSLSTLFVAAAGGILLGIIFGAYPAHRAATLVPVDAIRHE